MGFRQSFFIVGHILPAIDVGTLSLVLEVAYGRLLASSLYDFIIKSRRAAVSGFQGYLLCCSRRFSRPHQVLEVMSLVRRLPFTISVYFIWV